jgi:hypothetical protein
MCRQVVTSQLYLIYFVTNKFQTLTQLDLSYICPQAHLVHCRQVSISQLHCPSHALDGLRNEASNLATGGASDEVSHISCVPAQERMGRGKAAAAAGTESARASDQQSFEVSCISSYWTR